MSDLIDDLPYNEKTKQQIRAILDPDELLFDVLDVMGKDRYGLNLSGTLLITNRRIAIAKTKLFGKPSLDEISWTSVTDYGLAPGDFPLLALRTAQGDWHLSIGASGYNESDERKRDRMQLVTTTMKEAQTAFAAAEGARQSESVGEMAEDLQKRRGF